MKNSENPARLPPHLRAAAQEQANPGASAEPATVVRTAGGMDDAGSAGAIPAAGADDGDPDIQDGDGDGGTLTGYWTPINDETPRDGRELLVRWSDDDAEGRIVSWRHGRYFNMRRWHVGGRWIPVDGLQRGMIPLPAASPTEWYRVPGHNDYPAASDAEPIADEAAA